jgi:hypothetical protein
VASYASSTVLINLKFQGTGHLYAVYDPALGNSRGGDSGRTAGSALLASDGAVASAFGASPAFTATSSGYLRLAANVQAGRVLEQPAVVADHYLASRSLA